MVTKRLQYRYDAVGNKVGMTDADGGLFTYTYDVMRRLTGVTNPLGERTTYVYDLNGRRTSAQLANGTRTSYSYDQGSRVQQIHTLKSNNSTVAKFDYAYDDNGRRTSVLEADGSRVTWTYDGTSQVTSEWRTGTSPFRHTFVYDTRGNRTLKVEDGARTTLVYDAANQLSSSEDVGGTTNYTYDANGNQHVTVAPGGSRTTQIWDYENRLVKTLQPGGGVSTMAYDADGLRVRKETPSEAKLFVWDDQNYLAETDDSGVTEVAYTTEPSTYGSTISHRSGGATTTYHFDALAATRVLTNASETVLESYNYTAFGTILGTPSLLTPFLWGGLVGYYWDADLSTQYIRARHYQPSIARWISLDPIGFAGGDANLFRYVGNSPTSGMTGRRVVLTDLAYGSWHLAISPSVTTLLLLSIESRRLREALWGFVPSMKMGEGNPFWGLPLSPVVDYSGLWCNTFDVVIKSFIADVSKFGGTGGFPKRGGLEGLLGLRRVGSMYPMGPVMYDFKYPDWLQEYMAGFYNLKENPITSEMDGKYRMYSQYSVKVCCCEKGNATTSSTFVRNDAGKELPFIYGLVKTLPAAMLTYGRPNKLAEPSFQLIAERDSPYIWHQIKVGARCEADGTPIIRIWLTGSRFPSHTLFIDGKAYTNLPQGTLNNLWNGENGLVK